MSQGLVMFTQNADVSGPEPAYYPYLQACRPATENAHPTDDDTRGTSKHPLSADRK